MNMTSKVYAVVQTDGYHPEVVCICKDVATAQEEKARWIQNEIDTYGECWDTFYIREYELL